MNREGFAEHSSQDADVFSASWGKVTIKRFLWLESLLRATCWSCQQLFWHSLLPSVSCICCQGCLSCFVGTLFIPNMGQWAAGLFLAESDTVAPLAESAATKEVLWNGKSLLENTCWERETSEVCLLLQISRAGIVCVFYPHHSLSSFLKTSICTLLLKGMNKIAGAWCCSVISIIKNSWRSTLQHSRKCGQCSFLSDSVFSSHCRVFSTRN